MISNLLLGLDKCSGINYSNRSAFHSVLANAQGVLTVTKTCSLEQESGHAEGKK